MLRSDIVSELNDRRWSVCSSAGKGNSKQVRLARPSVASDNRFRPRAGVFVHFANFIAQLTIEIFHTTQGSLRVEYRVGQRQTGLSLRCPGVRDSPVALLRSRTGGHRPFAIWTPDWDTSGSPQSLSL